jgi:cytochrome c oxidase subunit 3
MLAGASLLATMIGASAWVNSISWGMYLNIAGILSTLTVLYFWFGDAIAESEGGMYNQRIDSSFRWSMSWFIFSEVMFFGAFFGALFYARSISFPWLADLDHKLIWPDFTAQWTGSTGPAGTVDGYTPMGPFPIPTINTALLLTSGVTLTISHHALRAGHRKATAIWLAATVLLGAIFMGFQAYEYMHAYSELNLKLTSGIYGSTFFMLTGFHGFHVTVGAIMLACVLYRVMKGHFTPEHHFAFEGAAWYWHFVDVVWLGLYVVVYWM